MTPHNAALFAQQAYASASTYGAEDSAARIVVFNDPNVGCVWAIPGTNNFSCLEADVDALLHDAGPYGQVHAGIWRAFSALWKGLPQGCAYPDFLIGHSEGAAGAVYLAAMLCLAKKPTAVFAFEPPHTSTDTMLRDILRAAGVSVYLSIHGRDLVPMVPVPIPGEDWQHATEPVRFGKPSSIFPNIEDHMIAGIIADLAAQ